jgi:hypothetical protein
MVRRRLTLYDVIVDLIPGLLAVGMLVWLGVVPVGSSFMSNLGSGLILLAGGYTVGRLVHGVTGMFEDFFLSCYECLFDDIRFESRLREMSGTEHSNQIPVVSHRRRMVREKLTHAEADPNQYKELKHLSESFLYDQARLSWKYSLLSTFFRNIWLIALLISVLLAADLLVNQDPGRVALAKAWSGFLLAVFSFIFALATLHHCYSDDNSSSVDIYLRLFTGITTISVPIALLTYFDLRITLPQNHLFTASILFFIFSLVGLHQYFKFKRRENRAMINELYLGLIGE